MLKVALAVFIALHGLLHLLGFAKEWHLSSVMQLSGETTFPVSKWFAHVLGILWLLTCMILLFAAISLLLNSDWWWIATLSGTILSETLITIYWSDAKAGSVANIILFVILVMAINGYL